MNANNKIIRAAAVVFGFWWLVFTIRAFGGSPMLFLSNWALVGYNVSNWVLGVVSGLFIGVWFIWFARLTALNKLYAGKNGNNLNGVRSTLGSVPMPSQALERVESASKRLPIDSAKVLAWISANEKKWPAHIAFFWAIWDTYSAHAHYPASHRKGGHGNRRLWQHCLAVAETALQDAESYTFDGVYVKARGKPKLKIIDLKNKEYRFDATDPLIPVLALAHDIGKLEAYVIQADGSVKTQEEGGALTPQDDNRISHDSLGARILARFPEYWRLPARDRRAVNLVIAHYHHPSSFPVDRNGLSLDDRMTALMEYLILVDKKTGMAESSITETLTEQEISEDETSTIYHSFVDIITEFGRVNGTGDQAKDSTIKIAQKHDGLIVIREKDLRSLILAKMGWSLEEGDGRYRLTLNLMSTLQEKGILYSNHNQADMSRFLPMFSVSFRNAQTGAHQTTWEPCIIIRPVATTPELAALSGLSNLGTKLDIERPLFTHNLGITETEALRTIIARGFGPEIAAKVNIAGKQEAKPKVAPGVALQSPTEPTAQPDAGAASEPHVTLPVPVVTETEATPTTDPIDCAIELSVEAEPQPESVPVPQSVGPAQSQGYDPIVDCTSDDDLLDDDLESLSLSTLESVTTEDAQDDFDSLDTDDQTSEDVEDVFGAFEEDVSPATAEVIDPVLSGSTELPELIEPGPIKPVAVAVAIPDPDAQPTRKKSPAAEAAALKALEEAGVNFTAFVALRRKKASSVNQLERIRAAVKEKEIPICGTRDGFDYLLESDLQSFDSTLNLKALIKSEKLPTVEARPGVIMIGVPIAPMMLDL